MEEPDEIDVFPDKALLRGALPSRACCATTPLVTSRSTTAHERKDIRRGWRSGRLRDGKDARCSNVAASGVGKAVLGGPETCASWRRCASHRWRAGAATLERTRARPVAQSSTVKKESRETWAQDGRWLKAQRHYGLQVELKSRNQRAARTGGKAAGSMWRPEGPRATDPRAAVLGLVRQAAEKPAEARTSWTPINTVSMRSTNRANWDSCAERS